MRSPLPERECCNAALVAEGSTALSTQGVHSGCRHSFSILAVLGQIMPITGAFPRPPARDVRLLRLQVITTGRLALQVGAEPLNFGLSLGSHLYSDILCTPLSGRVSVGLGNVVVLMGLVDGRQNVLTHLE